MLVSKNHTAATNNSYLKKFLNMASLVPPGVVGVLGVVVEGLDELVVLAG